MKNYTEPTRDYGHSVESECSLGPIAEEVKEKAVHHCILRDTNYGY